MTARSRSSPISHLAVYARTTAQTGGRALPSVTLRYGCEFLSFEQDAAGVSMQVRFLRRDRNTARRLPDRLRPAVRARCASSSGSIAAAKATCSRLWATLYRGDELFDKLPIGDGPAKAALIMCGRSGRPS